MRGDVMTVRCVTCVLGLRRVRVVIIVRVIMTVRVVKRMLDMLRGGPTRLAPEGQEHQAPGIEAGQQRDEHPDEPYARLARSPARLDDRISNRPACPADANLATRRCCDPQ